MSTTEAAGAAPQAYGLTAALDAATDLVGEGLAVLERTLLYHQGRDRRPPDGALPGAVTEQIQTADGEKVLVWGVPPQPGRPVVLYFHGNGETVYSRPVRFRSLAKAGLGVLGLSYRGYVASTGLPSEDGLHRDAEALYRMVRTRHPDSPVALWGYSLGSAVAVRLAAEHPVDKVVLESPFTSTVEVGAIWFPYLCFGQPSILKHLMSDHFRSDQRISQVTAPLLVLHGEADRVVPLRFGERLFSLANEPKRLATYRRAGHFDMDRHGALRDAVEFIET